MTRPAQAPVGAPTSATHTPAAGAHLLAVDWGTSSLRGALMRADGSVIEERSFTRGILTVPAGEFARVFDACFGDWIRAGAGRALISGMAGSKQGWIEAPYCPCPGGFADLAAKLIAVHDDALRLPVFIVPGMSCENAPPNASTLARPDVMRGEEVQIFGAMQTLARDDGVFVLPGTHSKWARVQGARVTHFRTYMTGEFYALLTQHSIIGRTLRVDAPFDQAAFEQGLAQARHGGGLLHTAFSARTLALFERLGTDALASYLSGLLIGEELQAQDIAPQTPIALIGSHTLTERYALALRARGADPRTLGSEATWAGLHALSVHLSPGSTS